MLIDPEKQTYRENYTLMSACIVPRPIAFVSTVSIEGVFNLAPFSYFNGVTSAPPTLSIAIARKSRDSNKKDTLSNILDTGEFVVNTVSVAMTEAMNRTARDFPPEVNEFTEAGLTAIPARKVKAPLVKESPVKMECTLYKSIEIGEGRPGSGFLVIGEIVMFHIADEIWDGGQIDMEKLDPLGRLSGNYTTLGRLIG
ncbi:MAG TPA: flavin reductase family protein [Caldithrix abyssi]|uniref:Flavin reductase family protein n=1 Tax=Caldithrix abyssi TaxID=187145 RepID=A0A7V4TYP7_CALAY|nr:flavin reductase family protein [Caldithrix abyssi]